MTSRPDDGTTSTVQRKLAEEVAAEHEREPHEGVSAAKLRLHLLLHVVAETQVAGREPPAAAEALERLMAGGVDRHRAMHAICDIVAEEVVQVVGKRRVYDEARYVARLARLEVKDCR